MTLRQTVLYSLWTMCFVLMSPVVCAQEPEAEDDSENQVQTSEDETGVYMDGEELTEKQVEALATDTQTMEDPDAIRRVERETRTEQDLEEVKTFTWDYYGSARIHAINAFDFEEATQEAVLADGASRVGITGEWHWKNGWNLFGRLESGFDILDVVTERGQNDDGGIFTPRLYNITFETDNLYAKYGKSWSVYYQVAGVTDRFSIFGGSAAGVYNAGTDGGNTGTGRANDSLQTRVFVDMERWTTIRPTNLNLQFQQGQEIPRVQNRNYGHQWSFSFWQDTRYGVGLGVAYHRAEVDMVENDPVLQMAGIDGDAEALALGFKTSGDRWFLALVYAQLDNIETTDELKYFNGKGIELFGQWQFRDKWWLVGGANVLEPDEESKQAGDYLIKHGILGLRYTLDGFNRMLYGEWRIANGELADGRPVENELTVGFRWDFGY